ncbi:MAG: addiction module protein [Candidatus Omnitrophica bacterium]|nr:addiction module protein [Candidatus Omnitrophota bacterium]
MTVKNIEKNILQLSPIQRLRMVDNILASLDKPDPEIEREWGVESDKRLAAYKNGKLKGINFETIKKQLAK